MFSLALSDEAAAGKEKKENCGKTDCGKRRSRAKTHKEPAGMLTQRQLRSPDGRRHIETDLVTVAVPPVLDQ